MKRVVDRQDLEKDLESDDEEEEDEDEIEEETEAAEKRQLRADIEEPFIQAMPTQSSEILALSTCKISQP